MTDAPPPTDARGQLGGGLLAMALGGGVVLAALGVIPAEAHAPPWVGAAAGMAFVLAGCALVVQALGRASPVTGVLAADAPTWTRWAQAGLAAAVMALLASIGTWVAFGPGERVFSGDLGGVGAVVGRVVFGIGAVMAWGCVGLFAVVGVRRARGKAS